MFPVFVSTVLEYCGKAILSNIFLHFFVSICVTELGSLAGFWAEDWLLWKGEIANQKVPAPQ